MLASVGLSCLKPTQTFKDREGSNRNNFEHSELPRSGMLLVLPAPFYRKEGKLVLETQACNGIEKWADHFGKVIVVAPLLPDKVAEQERTIVWQDTATLDQPERFELIPVPWAYSIKLFTKHYTSTRKLLAGLINRCQYLQFPLGGLFGDWGAVASLEAQRQNRPYAVHTDLVEDQVVLQLAQGKNWISQLKSNLFSLVTRKYYKGIIQNSGLALLHGEDCHAAYSSLCQTSFLVHDTHTKPEDAISHEALAKKIEALAIARTLRICYTGRMAPMKAPLDWVRAVGEARDRGVAVQATWLGDGVLREEVQQLVADLGLGDCIELVGYESDRQKVLECIRSAHLMLFTHVTSESPRCLIEAFVSGTAIVGYHSRYAEDLTQDGGGALVPVHQWQELGKLLQDLWHDRPRLIKLVEQAAAKRTRFNDEAVFQERSELIKRYLG
ncbi:MAG: glycosyltransferase [Timaviella obliquedivisa GSE-PSE-MK23-08B]|nr:glycosyltransferase [Timaviella obliquedivisa GSE-PSE-MK23-08B]